MKKRILSLSVSVLITLSFILTPSSANELFNSDSGTEPYALTGYQAVVMQGNTYSASDCAIFRNGLLNSGNGYSSVLACGWSTSTGKVIPQRVTSSQLSGIYLFDVAYYSGHGGSRTVDGNKHPVLNYIPSNSSNNYGTSEEIDVATLFSIDSSSWRSNCTLSGNTKTKVLILAACSQLDSSVVKYYARLMRASGIRVIAGYHSTAPGTGTDDTIAQSFLDLAAAGNSVWYSWKNANECAHNWAILVYENNNNQYYRLPGFPGNTYTTPSSSAIIYRYADFLDSSTGKQEVNPASLNDDLTVQLLSLPLTITTSTRLSRSSFNPVNRETTLSNVSVSDNENAITTYLSNTVGTNVSDTICVKHYISREAIDEDTGTFSGSETIVERIYDYYSTYQGIKIADSYVSASLDSAGIHNVSMNLHDVVSTGRTVAQTAETRSVPYISLSDAIQFARNADLCEDAFELYDTALAYAPSENGEHVLCYEVMTSHGFFYINIVDGSLVYMN